MPARHPRVSRARPRQTSKLFRAGSRGLLPRDSSSFHPPPPRLPHTASGSIASSSCSPPLGLLQQTLEIVAQLRYGLIERLHAPARSGLHHPAFHGGEHKNRQPVQI